MTKKRKYIKRERGKKIDSCIWLLNTNLMEKCEKEREN
jgi:hypothetical protein